MYSLYRQTPLTRTADMSDMLKGQRWPEGDPGAAGRNEEFKSNNQDRYPPK